MNDALRKSMRSASDREEIAVAVDRVFKTYPIPFLRLKKLLHRKFKPPVEALRNISFSIGAGEIFGLIGPNGAGKTTLTKIIATLIQPTAGAATVNGHDTVRDDERVRRNVGLAGAEERSFYWRLTAEQNLLFFARLYGLNERDARRRITELFELFGFDELARRRFAELSTGNKQRLAVARAMLANPPVLLLDEPTRSLDPIAAARMRETIQSLAQDRDRRVTIFLTSHNLTEVEELCDRVAIIGKGEIRAIDSPSNLRALHTQQEQVLIEFTALDLVDAERALSRSFGMESFILEVGSPSVIGRGAQSVVKFKRSANDEVLDRVLQILQQSGAVIRSVDIERPTLLDVLESYEKEPNNRAEAV
jgi:ABC-2 type transport system ATP-binding protein